MYPSDVVPPSATSPEPGSDYQLRIVRLFGPEIGVSVTVDLPSLELQINSAGDLRVAGRVFKSEGDELRIGLDVVVVGRGITGVEFDRRRQWTKLKEAGDEDRFDLWLHPQGRRITELRFLFEENGPLVICSICGGLIDTRDDDGCQDCNFAAYVKRRKAGR